jgi:hypothetical protein
MVNTPIIRHPNPFVNARRDLPWPPPECGDNKQHTRVIPFKVWALEEVQTIAQSHIDGKVDVIQAVTNDCIDDMQKAKMTLKEVAELLLMLERDDYENSQWCMTSPKPGVIARPEFRWLPCDAYTLIVEEEDEHEFVSQVTYYIKLCRTIAGGMLLMVSLHPSIYH